MGWKMKTIIFSTAKLIMQQLMGAVAFQTFLARSFQHRGRVSGSKDVLIKSCPKVNVVNIPDLVDGNEPFFFESNFLSFES